MCNSTRTHSQAPKSWDEEALAYGHPSSPPTNINHTQAPFANIRRIDRLPSVVDIHSTMDRTLNWYVQGQVVDV